MLAGEDAGLMARDNGWSRSLVVICLHASTLLDRHTIHFREVLSQYFDQCNHTINGYQQTRVRCWHQHFQATAAVAEGLGRKAGVFTPTGPWSLVAWSTWDGAACAFACAACISLSSSISHPARRHATDQRQIL